MLMHLRLQPRLRLLSLRDVPSHVGEDVIKMRRSDSAELCLHAYSLEQELLQGGGLLDNKQEISRYDQGKMLEQRLCTCNPFSREREGFMQAARVWAVFGGLRTGYFSSQLHTTESLDLGGARPSLVFLLSILLVLCMSSWTDILQHQYPKVLSLPHVNHMHNLS